MDSIGRTGMSSSTSSSTLAMEDALSMMPAAQLAGPMWPLLLYFVIVVGLIGLMLGGAWLLGEHGDHRDVEYPFESGILPVGYARFRLSVQFYMVAMFFVLFDLETVFLLAWAVAFWKVGWAGYAVAVIFIVELLAGLAYVWRVGALDWAPNEGRAALALADSRS